MKPILILAPLLLLMGCGKQDMLKPAPGHGLPQKPLMARETPTPDDLLTPSAEERPERNVEPMKRSRERDTDPFDLPPS